MRVRAVNRGTLTGQQHADAVRDDNLRSRPALTRGQRAAQYATGATARSLQHKLEADGQLDPEGQIRAAHSRASRQVATRVLAVTGVNKLRIVSAGRNVFGSRSQAVSGAIKDATIDGGKMDYEETAMRISRHGHRTVTRRARRMAMRGGWKLAKVGGKATWVTTQVTAKTAAIAAVAGGRLTGAAVTSSARWSRAAARRTTAAARRRGAGAARKARAAAARVAQGVARAAVAAARAAATAVVSAVGGSTLPIVAGTLAAVLLLLAIVPSFTIGVGQQQTLTGAAACSNATYDLGPVEAHTQAAAELLGGMFGVTSIGGYRPGNTYDYAGHPAGLAIDIMTRDRAHGQQIADYAQAHAADLGVLYIIWWQQIWSVDRSSEGWRGMADRGSVSANHKDHVHISFVPNPTGDGGQLAQLLADACGDVASSGTVTADGWTMPSAGRVSSPYGMRRHPVTGIYKLHSGTDYAAGLGAPIYAAAAGTVTVTHPGWAGNLITIDHGGGTKTRYAHMYSADVLVRTGDVVSQGQKIGRIGSAGWSTGPHLHFEVMIDGSFVDPAAFLQKKGL